MSEGICPICNKENKCAQLLGKDPMKCWCMTIKVPKTLLDQVSVEKRGKACICQACVEKAKKIN